MQTREQILKAARAGRRLAADRRLAVQLRSRGWVVVEPGSAPVGPVVPITDDALYHLGRGHTLSAIKWARRFLEASGCVVPLHAFEVQHAEELKRQAAEILGADS